MMSRSLWRGFDPPTTRPPPRSRNRLKEINVHYLFSVRNMFLYNHWGYLGIGTILDLAGPDPLCHPTARHCEPLLWHLIQTDAHFICCSPANMQAHHDWKTHT